MSAQATAKREVVVVGMGPSGLCAAIELARRGREVTLLGRPSPAGARVGEQLSGAGVLALKRACPDLDLARVGRRSPGVRSAWGERDLHVRSDLFEPHGPSLVVDRNALEQALLASACSLGVIHRAEHVLQVARDEHGSRLTTCARTIDASFAVDASGRSATLARALGARILRCDRLVAVAAEVVFKTALGEQSALVESTATGFWYSVPISACSLAAMYFTDAAQLQGRELLSVWHAASAGSEHTQQRLRAGQLRGALHVRPACSQRLDSAAFEGFLAIGDAAMAWDPLSSSGLTNALCVGEEAATAIDGFLAGDTSALTQFAAARRHDFARYLVARARHYRAETRFASAPFWRCRAQPALLEVGLRIHPNDRLVRNTLGSETLLSAGLSERTILAAVERPTCARAIVATLMERTAHAYLPEELIGALQLLLDRGALSRVSAAHARSSRQARALEVLPR